MSTPIYLDYAAATPLDGGVMTAMKPYFTERFYNPSSSYTAAKTVRQALEDARRRVAHWLGAKPAEVIFTAGATESINIAIHGVARQYADSRVVTAATEHEAVRMAAALYDHAVAPVKPDGTIDIQSLKHRITDTTVLVSVAMANNEIGTIQSLRDVTHLVADIRRMRRLKNNDRPLYVHTDASQAGCYLDIHTSRLGVDLLTLNGGKIYGPKQSGVLFVKAGLALQPLIVGGGQEMNWRSGTENVPAIMGFATALDIAQSERKETIARVGALRDDLQHRLAAAFPGMKINGSHRRRLPNNLHVSWPGIDGERLVMMLDERGVMASTGSACAANKQTASYVLQACGFDEASVQGSLRLTLGRQTRQTDIVQAASRIISTVKDMGYV